MSNSCSQYIIPNASTLSLLSNRNKLRYLTFCLLCEFEFSMRIKQLQIFLYHLIQIPTRNTDK